MHHIVEFAIKMAHKLLASLNLAQHEALYVLDPKKYRADVLETLVEIVFEALAAVSNKFKGFDDPFWITVIQTVQRVYPSLSGVPDGLTPFQQRLALKLIDKLSDNMRGYYPRYAEFCSRGWGHTCTQPRNPIALHLTFSRTRSISSYRSFHSSRQQSQTRSIITFQIT